MEKVKITVAQEKALKVYKSYESGVRNPKYSPLGYFIKRKENFFADYKPLIDFTPEQFALLLCGWYEVEQPFKVGDWVYDKANDKYWKLEGKVMNMYKLSTILSVGESAMNGGNYTKVTDQWKIEMLELGREKPELRVGDMFVNKSGMHVLIKSGADAKLFIKQFESGAVKRFSPAERSIEFK